MEVTRMEECLGHTRKRLKKHLKKKTPSKLIPKSKVEIIGHIYALVTGKYRSRTPLGIQNTIYTLMNNLFEEIVAHSQKIHGVTFRKASQFQVRIPLIHFPNSDNPI